MKPNTTTQMLTVDELALRLAVGANTVRCLVRDNRIPHLRVGKSLRFIWEEVVAALRPSSAMIENGHEVCA